MDPVVSVVNKKLLLLEEIAAIHLSAILIMILIQRTHYMIKNRTRMDMQLLCHPLNY